MTRTFSEKRQYTPEDMVPGVPKCFDNDDDGHAAVSLIDMYGMIFENGDGTKKPIMYFRHANPSSYRFGSFLEFGDGYLSYQTGNGHFDDVANNTTKVNPYRKISDGPLCYGIDSDEPFSEYRFYLDHATYKEGDFFECTATPFTDAFVDHGTVFPGLCQISQPSILEGTYEGKPFKGIGSYDRVYMPTSDKRDIGSVLAYVLVDGVGIRPDGRKESVMCCIKEDGSQIASYWLEGEEPISSDKAEIITEWVHLPYVNDGTVTWKDATVRFADREFHFIGKWGTKGFTKEPRIERHGQSQQFGTFYAGDTPYQHQIFLTFNEAMEAYDYKIEKLGWKVID